MKLKSLFFTLPALLAAAFFNFPANADDWGLAPSEDECAIWLCAPGGFPDGCEGAHDAMRKRLLRGDSPVPPFQACSKDDGGMTSEHTKVVKVLAHKGCAGKDVFSDGDSAACYMSSVWVEEQFVDIPSCRYDFGKLHDFCVEGWHKIDVYQNGEIVGASYYFTLAGY